MSADEVMANIRHLAHYIEEELPPSVDPAVAPPAIAPPICALRLLDAAIHGDDTMALVVVAVVVGLYPTNTARAVEWMTSFLYAPPKMERF
jgi:hypothetical protein